MKTLSICIFSTLLMLSMFAEAKKPYNPFTPIVYTYGTAVLEGNVVTDAASTDIPAMKWVFLDAITNDEVTTDIVPSADGHFRAEAKMCGTSRCLLMLGDERITFFASPDEPNVVTIDMKMLADKDAHDRAINFGGRFDKVNSDLFTLPNPRMIFQPAMQSAPHMGLNEYKQMLLKIYEDSLNSLNKKKISDATKSLIRADWQQELCIWQARASYASMRGSRNIDDFPAPDGYYDNLLEMNIGTNPLQPYTVMANATASILQMLSEECPDFAAQHEAMETQPIVRARKAARQLADYKPFTAQQLIDMRSSLPEFYSYLAERSAALELQIAENADKGGYRIMAIDPELEGENIFKAIVAPYKGKPVLVDFWATWCGPCRRAMELIKPVKEELADQAWFVYVSSPTSPEGLWKNMIADIHGDHYYVTDEQWRALLQQFESQGIPTYVIVDKDGNIVSRHIGFPGEEVIGNGLKSGM